MSVFQLPSSFCNELRSLVSGFWWGSERGKRKIPWVAWKKMRRHKGEGGLGFRDFEKFNEALLGKQAWRIIANPDCLMARVLKGKYFPNKEFMESDLGTTPSYTWRGIWSTRRVVLLGARKRVGDSKSIWVWADPWIPNTQSRRVISPRGEQVDDLRVCELFNEDGVTWNEEKLATLFLPFECERIQQIRISESKPPDEWCWELEKDGQY
ncbi:putative mitochondrial protein AtMg00310 [Silene latifolia]|uniref:putative mitochondrial protein AtMg00310 n=1 Tax=Silene latifolia TaxID=37657 RepID=UPI003D783311